MHLRPGKVLEFHHINSGYIRNICDNCIKFYYLPPFHWMVDLYIYPCLSVRASVCPSPAFSPRCHKWIFLILHTFFRYQLGLMHVILDFNFFSKWPPGSHFSYLKTIVCAQSWKLCMWGFSLFSTLSPGVVDFVIGSKMAAWWPFWFFFKNTLMKCCNTVHDN